GDVAEAVARDVQHAFLDAEDLARVLALRVLQPGGESFQVLAIEQADGGLRSDGPGPVLARGKATGYEPQNQRRWQRTNHDEIPPSNSRSELTTLMPVHPTAAPADGASVLSSGHQLIDLDAKPATLSSRNVWDSLMPTSQKGAP